MTYPMLIFFYPRGIQPLSGSYWSSSSRASVTTMSSFGSASSVAEEAESRDLSAASSSSISAADNGRQKAGAAAKNGVKGKEGPWIMRSNNTASVDAR